MSNFMCVYSILLSTILLCSCGSKAADNKEVLENNDNEELTSSVSLENSGDTAVFVTSRDSAVKKSLLTPYSASIKDIRNNYVYLSTGDSLLFDDGKEKGHQELLDDADVEDMFKQTYKLPDGSPEYLFDPGRGRSEALFKAMYGSSAKEVERNLTTVEWFGQNVKFSKINGAADSLRTVAKELANHPELKPYLKSSGTFYWRPVRGAKRMSAHSYGIAFDIGVDKSNYWQWTSGSNDELKKVEYQNKIPLELVKIFQKHGFIWGGAWYHYDTMHFEFRPDLLLYAEIMEDPNK